MTEVFYLFTQPFVEVYSAKDYSTYLYEYLSDTERADVDHIRALVLKFAVDENLVEVSEDKRLMRSGTDDTGSWKWMMNHLNFRSLVDMNQYGKLMSVLQADGNNPLDQILDLHVRLGAMFDPKLLNTLTHRVMTSVQAIPYEIPKLSEAISWKTIHKETPFIWLVIFTQMVMRSTITKIS